MASITRTETTEIQSTIYFSDKKKIEYYFGSLFCEIIGVDTILKMDEVSAIELNLDHPEKIPNETVLPSHLKGRSVVKSIDGYSRPLIALHLDLLDENKKKICEVVELVYKQYGLYNGGGKGACYENEWVAARINTADNGVNYLTSLCKARVMRKEQSYLNSLCTASVCVMSKEHLQCVKELLMGNTIVPPYSTIEDSDAKFTNKSSTKYSDSDSSSSEEITASSYGISLNIWDVECPVKFIRLSAMQ